MDKVIVIKNSDGSVGIVVPAPEMFDGESRTRKILAEQNILTGENSEEKILEWIIKKDVPVGASYRIIDRSQLPADRTFRDAWTDDFPTETVDINMEKARAIHMDKIRTARNKALAKLDAEHRKASGDVSKQAEIDAKAQILRDIPSTFDLSIANTIDELKSLWPAELA